MVDECEICDGKGNLRAKYITKAFKIQKQPAIKVGTVENLRKRYEK